MPGNYIFGDPNCRFLHSKGLWGRLPTPDDAASTHKIVFLAESLSFYYKLSRIRF
jgi:hypothetical protein